MDNLIAMLFLIFLVADSIFENIIEAKKREEIENELTIINLKLVDTKCLLKDTRDMLKDIKDIIG